MKKPSVLVFTLTVGCAFAALLFVGASAEKYTVNTEVISNDQPAYAVPEDKAQQWENMQKIVLREHDVCIEHCGNEWNCLERCKTAHRSRLDREYQKLQEVPDEPKQKRRR